MSAFMGGAFSSPQNIPGTGYQTFSQQKYSPQSLQLLSQLFAHAGPQSYLSKLAGGDEATFKQIEEPALRQFGQMQANLGARFGGAAGGGSQRSLGALKSSGFQNAAQEQAGSFAQQLQAQRQGLQRQALQDLFGISNTLLGHQPYENFLLPQQKPFWQELLTAGIGGISQAGGQLGGLKGLQLAGLL